MMLNPDSISYCCMPLNRCSTQRKNPDWVSHQLQKKSTRITPLWRNRNLVNNGNINAAPAAIFMPLLQPNFLVADQLELVYLGSHQGTHHFAVDIDPEDEGMAKQIASEHEFVDLRSVGSIMASGQAAISAYARGLLYWHRHNQFCSRCGHATLSWHGGHMRQCINTECLKEHFPRTDPAVIMLVETRLGTNNTPACLLGRHGKLPDRVYSTLAGYVDPGENLEEAVAREIMEEAGITVDGIQYLGSQPWPFPSALMMGFIASASYQQLTVDPEELEDARWFSRDQVLSFGEIDDPLARYLLPRKDSIARNLINAWLKKTAR